MPMTAERSPCGDRGSRGFAWGAHASTRVKSIAVLALGVLLYGLVQAPAIGSPGQVDLPRYPSISPDGSEIVFTWGGDLWLAPAEDGTARRLTRHEMDDLRSSWSVDGEWIVFTSMRDGYLNLWRIRPDGTGLSQITHIDRHLRNPGFAQDERGKPVVTFSGLLEGDVYRDERPYKVDPEGGEYVRLHNAFGSDPRISPDGRRVAFTRGGHYHGWNRRHYRGPEAMDVWLHDRETGEFEAVTSRNGDDGSARWSGDGSLIFMSDRALDTVNLYRIDLNDEEREIERLTGFDTRDVQHFDVSADGRTAVLHVWDTLYTLDLEAADAKPEPLRLRAGNDGGDDYELRQIERDITEAALSPDGQVMAYVAYGRVYVRNMDEHSLTRPVTPGTHARHQDLAWSPDGLRLYFTSDADGTESIYRARVALTRAEIRSTPRLVEPQEHPVASSDAGEQVAETDAPAETQRAPEDPQPTGEEDADDPLEPAEPAEPADPPADPVTEPDPADPPPATEPAVLPDSVPEEDLVADDGEDLPRYLDPTRWHDAVQFSVEPVVQSGQNDRDVSPSPDGRSLAFRRGRGDLVIRDLVTGDERTLVSGWDSNLHWRWSPDSRYIAYSQNDLNFSANIFVVPADGTAEPVNITRHPRNDVNPRWSADGRKLTFISNRSEASYDLYRVYLDRKLEEFTARELTTYFRDARDAASKRKPLPVNPAERGETVTDAPELDLEDAWRRVARVTASPAHQTANEMTPGGDRYVFNSGTEGLVAMNWDGSKRERIGPRADVQHLSTTGDRVVYIAGGRVGVVKLSGDDRKHPDISDRIRIDLGEQSLQKFREAARVVGENFYRPDMKGLDWSGLVSDYESLVKRARTVSEFSDISNRLMGELAASHTGVSSTWPGGSRREASGRLGITHQHVKLEDGHYGYRVTDVVPGGPAARGPTPLQPGDVITAVDMRPFAERETLLQRLRGRVDQEVVVTFERPNGEGRDPYRTLLNPVGFGELARLRYDAFRYNAEARVHELSDGRLGYIHIQAMNQSSLEQFQADLYAAAHDKEGLIVDVRNNGGGHTTDRILTSIMTAEHAYTVPAGADESRTGHYPQDRLDAPRYTLSINMLANEKSYSNAEILAHAFRTLDRGTLVGMQTYGGVISTGSHKLIDGATVRRPFRGWYLPDGTDMEHNGAVPDLQVEQTPEDEAAGRDPQLERAVEDLLERLEAQGTGS